jgi:hypothetical protein
LEKKDYRREGRKVELFSVLIVFVGMGGAANYCKPAAKDALSLLLFLFHGSQLFYNIPPPFFA